MTNTLPKSIKRKRNKTYTQKRNPYKSYLNAKWKWEDVFNEIDEIKTTQKQFIKISSIKYGINRDTLQQKYNLYQKNNNIKINKENRGGSNKIFTIDEEMMLYTHIKNNFINKNKQLNNNIIKELALDEFKKKNNNGLFKISIGWCNMFKKRWNLSTQKVKSSKIAVNIPTQNEIELFLNECEKLKKEIKRKFFFNYDETSYNILNPQKTAIRIKGAKEVKIEFNDNLKRSFTLGLTISLGGSFLKPLIIEKGKTERCLNKFKLTDKTNGTYTNKGWADENCIILIMDEISTITKNEKSVLLMDQYGSHMTDKVKEYAKTKNIIILYVPVGMTSKYQPLDVSINGILKCKAIRSCSKFTALNPNKSYTHAQCLQDFLINKKQIKKGTIIKSFECLKKIEK